MASPLQFYPSIKFAGIHMVGERHCESKVSYPTTQHNVPGLTALSLAQTATCRSRVSRSKHEATVCQQQKDGMLRLNFNSYPFTLKQVLYFLVILLNYHSLKNCTIKLTCHPFQKCVTR